MAFNDYLGPGVFQPGLFRGWAEVWHHYAWVNSSEFLIYVCVCVFFMCLLIFCGYNKATVFALTECDCSYLAFESDGSLQNNNVTEAGGEQVSNHTQTPTCSMLTHTVVLSLSFIPFVILIFSHTHQGIHQAFYFFRKVGSRGVQRGWCFNSLKT